MTDLSLLVVNYNSWRMCADAVRSFREQLADGGLSYDVVVVDNASPQRDADAEQELERLLAGCGELVRHDDNSGYSRGMNLAYARCRGARVLVSNPDVIFKPGCVAELVRYADRHAEAGAVAPMGYWDIGMDGLLPPNILPTLGDLWRMTLAELSPRHVRRYSERRTREALPVWTATEPVRLAMLSGCCFLMRREVIERIGFFDDRFPLYFEDTDLSMRILRAGLEIVQVPTARLVHLYNRSGETAHEEAMRRYWVSRRRWFEKWYGRLGARFYDLTRWLLRTRWGQRRTALPAWPEIHDIGTSNDKPTLRFPRPMRRYLVEGALDPRFFLAAGIFGSGDSWTPSDSLFRNFGPTTYYWRVLDLEDPDRPRQVGIYRHTLVYPTRQMAELPAEAPA